MIPLMASDLQYFPSRPLRFAGIHARGGSGKTVCQEVKRTQMNGTPKQTDSLRRWYTFRRRLRSRITMHLSRLSMRTSFVLAMILVGLLGVYFVLASGSAFRHSALENQRVMLGE